MEGSTLIAINPSSCVDLLKSSMTSGAAEKDGAYEEGHLGESPQLLRSYLMTSPFNQPPASQKQPINHPLIQVPFRVRCHPAAVCCM